MKALIKDAEDRILLLRESDGSWELPGGGLEQGEDARTGLARELDEETGFKIEWMNDAPVAFWTITRGTTFPNGIEWFAIVVYEAKVSGEFKPTIHDDDEGQEAKYFTREEVSTLKLHENTKPYFL